MIKPHLLYLTLNHPNKQSYSLGWKCCKVKACSFSILHMLLNISSNNFRKMKRNHWRLRKLLQKSCDNKSCKKMLTLSWLFKLLVLCNHHSSLFLKCCCIKCSDRRAFHGILCIISLRALCNFPWCWHTHFKLEYLKGVTTLWKKYKSSTGGKKCMPDVEPF